MTATLLALALALGGPPGEPHPTPAGPRATLPGPGPETRPAPPEDGLRHLGLSFAATSFAYGIARSALSADAALATAVSAAALAGIGKEISDRQRGGHADTADLLWDAAGLILGVALVRRIR